MVSSLLEWYTVDCLEAAVRSSPSTNAQVLAVVQLGHELQAGLAHQEAGRRWLRVQKQSLVDRLDGRGPVSLSLAREGFILAEDSDSEFLLPRGHTQVFEVAGPGQLSKAELAQLVRKQSAVLPLDARFLSPTALQKLLHPGRQGQVAPLSEGQAPSVAVVPSADSLSQALDLAALWLAEADALLVASGDSLGGNSWPSLRVVAGVDLDLEQQLCSAEHFRQEPSRAWEFFSHCQREAAAHPGLSPQTVLNLLRFSARLPQGGHVVTAAWDGAWERGGWGGKVLELHGSMTWQQCCRPELCSLDVWQASGEAEEDATTPGHPPLPTCPRCGSTARPNVQMYGMDYAFSKRRFRAQMNAYNEWLHSLETTTGPQDLRLVCLELECGLAVPTLRREIESVMRRFPSARLIRTNTESMDTLPTLSARCVVLPFEAETSLRAIHARQHRDWLSAAVNCVLWDEAGGGTEVLCHSQAEVQSILSTAAQTSAASLTRDLSAIAVAVSPEMGPDRKLAPDRRLPPWYLFQDAEPGCFVSREGSTMCRARRAAVLRLPGRVFTGPSRRLHLRVEATLALLAELSDRLAQLESLRTEQQGPAAAVAAARRRLLARACAEVLPRHGLPGDERSLGCWAAAALPTPQARVQALPSNLASWVQGLLAGDRGPLRHDDWELAPPGGPRFCIVGTWDNWKAVHDMLWDRKGNCYRCYICLGTNAWASFQILKDGSWDGILFPSCRDGGPHVPHTLCGPRKDGGHGKNWSIGMHKSDGAKPGERYEVTLLVNQAWTPERVLWTRLTQTSYEEQDAIERGFFMKS